MDRLRRLTSDMEWVLSHNDIHLDNVLIDEKKNVFLLDFEFTQFNYIGYDIGNFFNEWAMDIEEKSFEIREEW
jgi:ethanolamine kinase